MVPTHLPPGGALDASAATSIEGWPTSDVIPVFRMTSYEMMVCQSGISVSKAGCTATPLLTSLQ